MSKKNILKIVILISIGLLIFYYFTLWQKKNTPLKLYGDVDIREVNTSFRVSGRLMELNYNEGDNVRKGDLIARLDPEPYIKEVEAANAIIKQLKASLDYTNNIVQHEQSLTQSISDKNSFALFYMQMTKINLEKAIAELSLANLRLRDTYLYSSNEGIVLARVVEPGSMVTPNTTILILSLDNPVLVSSYVSENELSKVKPGTKVNIYTESNPNKLYSGTIEFVSSKAEFIPKNVETNDLTTNLVYQIKITIQDPQHELKQGMPVTIKFLK